jgi:chorismate mutase
MDNRINEIRRKISALRADMTELEGSIRSQIKHDLDCTESAMRLMAMRGELAALIGDWKAAGGGDRLPTVEVRPKENRRSPEKNEKPRALARR